MKLPSEGSTTRRHSDTNPTGLFLVLVLVNFLNYTDRSILPGSANEFIQLISSSLATSRPDIYLGFLQSSFIVGFSFASIIISHLVHSQGPFYLCAAGLFFWTVSAALSGIGFYANSFIILLIGRMLSGIGEASFVCIVPPWIATHAPPDQKGRWLAIFYTALPVGTAFGYSYAAFVANSLGVQWAFYMESFAMLPLIVIILRFAPFYPSFSSTAVKHPAIHLPRLEEDGSKITVSHIVLNPIQAVPNEADSETSSFNGSGSTKKIVRSTKVSESGNGPSMTEEFFAVATSPIYVAITAGIACQAAVLCGLGTFGSAFLMGLGYFDSETAASSTFGSVVCLAGILGTPLGGFLLDHRLNSVKTKEIPVIDDVSDVESVILEQECVVSDAAQKGGEKDTNPIASPNALKCVTEIATIGTFLGAILLCSVYFIHNRFLYLLLVTLGCLLIFLCSPSVNIGIMMAVPDENRSFAIALTSVCVHIFGDVPSPIITGLLKDLLAPGCSPPLSSPTFDLSSLSYTTYAPMGMLKGSSASVECRAEGHGLRLTMLIVSLWLFASAALFGAAWLLSIRKIVRTVHRKTPSSEAEAREEQAREKKEKKEKSSQRAFQSKRAYNRLQLQEPLLCLDDDDL